MSRQRGFTLIEILVVLGLTVLIAGMAVSLLRLAHGLHDSVRTEALEIRQWERLAGTLRRDANGASAATLSETERTLTLTLVDGGRGRYTLQEDGIRLDHSGPSAEGSSDSFRIAADLQWSIESDGQLVRLNSPDSDRSPLPPIVVAVLGKPLEEAP